MSLLFENLQKMNEMTKLEERNSLSVSEYDKLKIALNKNNPMKGNFILHPGEINQATDYLIKMEVYGAFKNKEHDTDSFYSYSGGYKNDEVTKHGVGTLLYIARINLIDETVTFIDNTYNLLRYLDSYERYLISNNIVKDGEMDIDSLHSSILDVISTSKVDLEKALHSKNFIYNLTGKRHTKDSRSSDYNLNLENIKLTEDFDSSMPNWLMRAIKTSNNSVYGRKDRNYNLPLDTMTWTVEPFPEKGKISNIGDDEIIALLIDKSGDAHRGEYTVYFPRAYIGTDETIEINGRNRRIDSMSLKALAPYVKEYAHTGNYNQSSTDLKDKQKTRATNSDGVVTRFNSEDDDAYYRYNYSDTFDKSGYLVDPNKYKRLLAKIHSDKYAERLEDIYVVLSDLREKLKAYATNDEIIPDAKEDRFKFRNVTIERLSAAIKYYKSAIRSYQYAMEELEKIAKGEKGRFGSEATEYFTKELSETEEYIVKCLEIIEPKQ